MRLVQFFVPEKGKRFGVVKGSRIWDLTSEFPTTLDVLRQSLARSLTIPDVLEQPLRSVRKDKKNSYPLASFLQKPSSDDYHLLIPIDPPEIWGAGVTYKRSAVGRDTDSQTDIYSKVYFSERPELFFKATAERCSPPFGPIGLRSDSRFTAPEAEVAIVLGEGPDPVAYALCNDVSAWDIERENPLYLPQSKIFQWCCSFGPWLTTSDQVPDPSRISLSCRIWRGTSLLFEGRATTAQMNRSFQDLISFLYRNNPIPPGSILTTGTGIMMGEECALQDGDVVEIVSSTLGRLVNTARRLGR